MLGMMISTQVGLPIERECLSMGARMVACAGRES